MQVILLAVANAENRPHGMSRHLIRASDGLEILPQDAIAQTVKKAETPPAAPSTPEPAVVGQAGGKPRTRATPKDLAGLGRSDAVRPSSSVLAYSAATGRGPQFTNGCEDPAELAEQIDLVVTNVLTAFRASATAEALAELKAGKPSIPRDIDKALLTDLTESRGELDLSERTRHQLRAHFWKKADETP